MYHLIVLLLSWPIQAQSGSWPVFQEITPGQPEPESLEMALFEEPEDFFNDPLILIPAGFQLNPEEAEPIMEGALVVPLVWEHPTQTPNETGALTGTPGWDCH